MIVATKMRFFRIVIRRTAVVITYPPVRIMREYRKDLLFLSFSLCSILTPR